MGGGFSSDAFISYGESAKDNATVLRSQNSWAFAGGDWIFPHLTSGCWNNDLAAFLRIFSLEFTVEKGEKLWFVNGVVKMKKCILCLYEGGFW